MPRDTGSSSWASQAPGSVVAGFRVERQLGKGSLGTVYEATQLSLGRTVALRLLEPSLFEDPAFAARFARQQRLGASLHHPNIVPTYEAGEWEGGRFVATRYVRGRTLDAVVPDGSVLESVGRALDAAHGAGLVHGRLTARNVILDAAGTAYVTDLGLGRPGTVEGDRRALEALATSVAPARSRRRPVAAAVAGSAIVVAALALAVGGGGGDDGDETPPPPIAAGAVALGSDLAPGPGDSVGCSDAPGPNTTACTLSQSAIAGRPVTVPRPGVIRRWAVRGASGELALQVVRRRAGRAFLRGFSRVERVRDGEPHAFRSSIAVERGDLVGVLLSPGAVIGARAAPEGTTALRWDGALDLRPRSQGSSRVERELLLRADIDFGGEPALPPQRTGTGAATAAPGRSVTEQVIDLAHGRAVGVALVRVGDGVALDAFRGQRRLARIDVAGAEAGGRLLNLESHCGYVRGLCVRWLNDGGATPVVHAYELVRGGRSFRVIG